MTKVLITGGAGYVGSVLVPKIIDSGYEARIFDLMIFGDKGLDAVKEKCEIIRGDLRNKPLVEKVLEGVDSVIHLAALSNDPCSDLNPKLTEEINLEASINIAECAKKHGIRRFIYASTGSVYGIKSDPHITEECTTEPLTVYAKTKAESEKIILSLNSPDFTTVALRPATTGGFSPRMRLDLITNIFANQAFHNRKIYVNGGEQLRPSIDIEDITDYYVFILNAAPEKIAGQVFNASADNFPLMTIAKTVGKIFGEVVIEKRDSIHKDLRNYPMVSEKIKKVLGLLPRYNLENTALGLKNAFERGWIANPSDAIYRNIETMKNINLK